jgi:GH15 family glucan-1,4-alpha-glucosidase
LIHIFSFQPARTNHALTGFMIHIFWRYPRVTSAALTSQHCTSSKIGCWTALDRAVRLVEAGQITTGHAQRWAAERDDVRAWVNRNCWSVSKGSFTFYAGTDELDAAILSAGRTGLDRGERLASTVNAVRRELARGPLLYRYSQMIGREGCFLACSFWLVSALTAIGRLDEARQVMESTIGLVNDLGLLSEEMDPSSHTMLGNFPQALSHMALINAATAFPSVNG